MGASASRCSRLAAPLHSAFVGFASDPGRPPFGSARLASAYRCGQAIRSALRLSGARLRFLNAQWQIINWFCILITVKIGSTGATSAKQVGYERSFACLPLSSGLVDMHVSSHIAEFFKRCCLFHWLVCIGD